MSKSRNEKKPPSLPPPVATSNDIIPGKFNENQWNALIDQENTVDYVLDLIDEILHNTVQVIYEKYIESQLRPYSVDAAKNLLLQIIEARFLKHDPGEVSPSCDDTWLEDDEPVSCDTDSWAEGLVPIHSCISRPLSAQSESMRFKHNSHETVAIEKSQSDGESEADYQSESIQGMSDNLEGNEDKSLNSSKNITPSPPPTSRVESAGRRKYPSKYPIKCQKRTNKDKNMKKIKPKRIPSQDNIVDVHHSEAAKIVEKCVGQTAQNRSPRLQEEVTFDESGNTVAMMRISVDKLPTRRIRPSFEIVEPQHDMIHSRKTTTRNPLISTISNMQKNSNEARVKKLSDHKQFLVSTNTVTTSLEAFVDDGEIIKPLPPPLADSMDISAGVVVREGQVVRKGPDLLTAGHHISRTDVLDLQPIGPLTQRQTISVSDVVGNTSPVIRKMRLPEPIPPIAHRR
ncbi:uncharacterized protein LOC124433510 [Xenia sp. Carnegie-2017]|uniref:uncharacterized protein LOC124433510 n=1 Tax=Xenia sp. Carnegie-2017 TaxID=2897299 RepID=UPI001F034834|nr:uncharacterized protein LOC124433510 [Xenia sp. Carnegie-2017]